MDMANLPRDLAKLVKWTNKAQKVRRFRLQISCQILMAGFMVSQAEAAFDCQEDPHSGTH